MAELSTIARPYAVGLMEALQERKASAQDMSAVLDAVSRLAETAVDPQIGQLEGDPGLTMTSSTTSLRASWVRISRMKSRICFAW